MRPCLSVMAMVMDMDIQLMDMAIQVMDMDTDLVIHIIEAL